MEYLVSSPEAIQFLDLAHLDSGLSAMLGDPSAIDAHVGPDVQSSRMVLKDAAKKVAALVKDPTRTDVQKHAAAKQLADKVMNHLERSKAALETQSEKLKSVALSQADFHLGPRSERHGLQSEIRGWVREQAKSTKGMEAIRQAMQDNDDVAAVLWHSPSFLVGLVPSVHESLRIDALQSRRPDLYADLSNSVGLAKLADKYAKAIRKVSVSFYNPEMAAQASKRVEI
ncbi:hypothetical protein F3I62_03500 [Pseudomonas sp. R-28-1W-6]|uniref:hypothetical protein n=1 Tax=Pseudomonas sp. R-28-1W-6 TaxID=2650101 RepID=UPI0013663BCF|nr:hypothetical protein [Pseudomonas sp. R-28-1W-6]MWV11153.1 hypothetical protein [Pseudomonas sp. R-28-1W-6]